MSFLPSLGPDSRQSRCVWNFGMFDHCKKEKREKKLFSDEMPCRGLASCELQEDSFGQVNHPTVQHFVLSHGRVQTCHPGNVLVNLVTFSKIYRVFETISYKCFFIASSTFPTYIDFFFLNLSFVRIQTSFPKHHNDTVVKNTNLPCIVCE